MKISLNLIIGEKVKFDVTMQVINEEGQPQEGTYIFSIYDMDIGDGSDQDDYNSEFAEGLNILEGIDLNNIKFSRDTLLVLEGNRIHGSDRDGATQASMMKAVADASNTKFTWTAGKIGCGTYLLAVSNPELVPIQKVDDKGYALSGAGLALYRDDTLLEQWESSETDKTIWLNPGTYTLKETDVPRGYTKADDMLIFVEDDGTLAADGYPVDKIEMVDNPSNETKYKVERYIEKLDGTYELKETETLTGTTNYTALVSANTIEGFTFDGSVEGSVLSGIINADESLVLKLYYRRNTYTVTYTKGDHGTFEDESYSQLYESDTPAYSKDPEGEEGYKFVGWLPEVTSEVLGDATYVAQWEVDEEQTKDLTYTVEYYKNGTKIDEVQVKKKVQVLSNEIDVDENDINTKDFFGEGYCVVDTELPDKVKEGDIIKVFYETDQYKHNENGEDSETGGDGIPDKAQVLIRYKVENGKWDNGSSNEIIQVITLYNEEENYSEDGTGSSLPPSVGNSPNEGYKKGSWNKEIPTKVSKSNDESEYIYSYEQVTDTKADSSDSEKPSNIDKNDGKKEKEIKNVEEKEKTSNNPKTSDTVQHYIAYGFAGMIFMMMVIRIRKKYGRKIRKIQY